MALSNANDQKTTPTNTDQTSGQGNTPIAQADNSSLAIGSFQIGGNVGGDVNIVHTIQITVQKLFANIIANTAAIPPEHIAGRSPYKGLDYFDEKDADLFFGRENLVQELVDRIQMSHALFVAGPSGSGKSSLVRAGLIPALRKASTKNNKRWLYAVMKLDGEPIAALARVTAKLANSTQAEDDIRTRAATDPTIFQRWCEIALGDGEEERVVIFIDQFEKIFTPEVKQETARSFVDLLGHAASVEHGRVILVFVIRSDFVANCTGYPILNDILNQQFLQIGAMQEEELVRSIALPALYFGLYIDPNLIAKVIHDMSGEPGALPLMQFALKDLFDSQPAQGGPNALTLTDYLRRGGIHKALERHANGTFDQLSRQEQDLAAHIFSTLVDIDDTGRHTKRTVIFDELIPANTKAEDLNSVVQKLADARLITTDEQERRVTITLVHEKLIEAWPWLRNLVNENREVITLRNHIAKDAKEWEDHNRHPSYLYSGARLANAREKLASRKLSLADLPQVFIHSSIDAETTAERRREQGRNLTIAISLIVSVVFLILAAYALIQSNRAEQQLRVAVAQKMSAQSQIAFAQGGKGPLISTLLAIEALQRLYTPGGSIPIDAYQALSRGLNLLPAPIAEVTQEGKVRAIVFSPDSKLVVSTGDHNQIRVWESATGKETMQVETVSEVFAVSWSPDGKLIAYGDGIGNIAILDATTGLEISRMSHESFVRTLSFSPNSELLVSGSDDSTARVWEVSTGLELARVQHGNSVRAVSFSPDGQRVVSGSWDHTARVWEAITGHEIADIQHEGPVYAAIFSPNGKWIASGGDDKTVLVWDAISGNVITEYRHDNLVLSISFRPDGAWIASGSYDKTARVWETNTGRDISRVIHQGYVGTVIFSSDGKFVLSGSEDGSARVWEAASGQEVVRMIHDALVRVVALSPSGQWIASGSDDGIFRIWDVRETMLLLNGSGAKKTVFSPDGKLLLGNGQDAVWIWDFASRQKISVLEYTDRVRDLEFSPDGTLVVSGGKDNFAHVWIASTGQEIARMPHKDEIFRVVFSPNGQLVASASMDGTVLVWDPLTGKKLSSNAHAGEVHTVSFGPDGQWVVSGGYDHVIRVWEATTGKQVAEMHHDDRVNVVLVSPDGKWIASASDDQTARVWDSTTGKEISRSTHSSPITALAIGPDGKSLGSGSFGPDGEIRVWDPLTGETIVSMVHDSLVRHLAFSADGQWLASSGYDSTIRVWEIATGQEVARMLEDGVRTVTFSPDSKLVVSGSDEFKSRLWLWQLNDIINEACTRLPRNLTLPEWQQYVGEAEPYHATCANLAAEKIEH